MLKRARMLILGVLIAVLSGCAYFNTFFNAKLYYQKGHKEARKNRTGKVSSNEKTYFNKAVNKSAKLIEYYPDSKYVDDAVLIMGKSYYYLQEYIKADRKFLEYLSNYPDSEWLHEALLWQAKTDLALEEFETAEKEFNDLLQLNVMPEIQGEASYFMGKMYEKRFQYAEAADYFDDAIQYGEEERKLDAALAAAVCYDSLDVFEKAAESYAIALKFDPPVETRFDARFKRGQMLKYSKDTEKAIRVFEELLNEQGNEKYSADLRLEIADALRIQGDVENAILAYQDITVEYENKQPAAEAYFNLGRLYERHHQDYDRAMDHYNMVRENHRNSVWADSAEFNARDVLRFQALNQVIEMGRTGKTGTVSAIDEAMEEKEAMEEDTLHIDYWMEVFYAIQDTAESDTSSRYSFLKFIGRIGGFTVENGKAFADSLLDYKDPFLLENEIDVNARRRRSQRPQGSTDWYTWVRQGEFKEGTDIDSELEGLQKYILEKVEERRLAENPELKTFRVEEIDRNIFLLAELFRSRFMKPDSAAVRYREIVHDFPDSPYAPRALYNLGYMNHYVVEDTGKANAVFKELIQQYPASNFANAARHELGLPHVPNRQDTLNQLFRQAESCVYDTKQYNQAVDLYAQIIKEYPDSDAQPKAYLAMGWVYEHRIDSLRLAYVTYDSLLAKFPESEYAKQIREKVEAVELAIEERAKQSEELMAVVPDSATVPSDSTAVEPVLKKPVVREDLAVSEEMPIDKSAADMDRARRRRAIMRRPGQTLPSPTKR